MASQGRSGRERGIKILPLKRVEDIPKGRPADWLHANDGKCAFQDPLELLNLQLTILVKRNMGDKILEN